MNDGLARADVDVLQATQQDELAQVPECEAGQGLELLRSALQRNLAGALLRRKIPRNRKLEHTPDASGFMINMS